MALSNLTLSLSACVSGNCSTISVTDTTGAYSITNTGGWDDSSTVFINTIATATLTITTPDGSIVTEDVTSQLPTSVTGSFAFLDITLPESLDGEYTISYAVTDKVGTKVKEITIYSLCKARNCVDAMWANYALNEYTATDCNCKQTTLSLKDTAFLGEALYKSIESSAICNNGVRDQLLAKLTRLCNLQDCNCD